MVRGALDRIAGLKGSPKGNPPPAARVSPGGNSGAKASSPLGSTQKIRTGPGAKNVPPPLGEDEVEGLRRDLEDLLKELILLTTEDWADERLKQLQNAGETPATAKFFSDKLRLTATEKKMFGKMVSRIYAKYLGVDFAYSDEIFTAALAIGYYLRNREGNAMIKKIADRSIIPKGTVERAGLQAKPNPDHRLNGSGEEHARGAVHQAPPGKI
jgi:hypothetical protein